MARKFDLISELYERTCFAVTDNPVNWQSFLKTAGRNFRLRFDEQLLIYAQRPDATAVLEIERWNGTFGRWVNRGAKGIAVFEDADRSRQRLIHYFDISDTHESRHSRPVPIWEMRPDYEAEVIETLENTFGAVNDTTSIENVVKESIANAVEDNIADYISDFMSLGAGSDIEYLSADEANALYLELVRNSVSYMPIGMLVVLDSILNRITQNRAKGKQTFIFIDEIYLLFQHEYSANFLFTLWKRVRKYGAYATGITQNVDDLLQSHTARTMLANSEFLIMLNQASTDRIELAKLLNISDLQLSYITNVDAGHGLIKVGSSLVPFANKFPKNTKLYKLMTTKPGEGV